MRKYAVHAACILSIPTVFPSESTKRPSEANDATIPATSCSSIFFSKLGTAATALLDDMQTSSRDFDRESIPERRGSICYVGNGQKQCYRILTLKWKRGQNLRPLKAIPNQSGEFGPISSSLYCCLSPLVFTPVQRL